MKTLVVAPNWIGDALMAQPMLAALRVDGATVLDVLAPAPLAPLIRLMPGVDSVIAAPIAHGQLQLGLRWQLARELRRAHYQRAIVLPNSFKSALVPRMAGIPERVGYVGEQRGLLLSHALPTPGRDMPMVERYLALVRPVTSGAPRPALTMGAAEVAAALDHFSLSPLRPLFVLCPGAEYGPAKRWPAGNFGELADALGADNPDAQIVILGGPGDREVAHAVVSAARTATRNLAGATSLEQAVALIAAAHGVVSNDSGLMHVAAALGRPQVAVFGSSDPRHTPPMSARAQVVWLHLECSPCFARECPLGHLRCLKEVSPAVVLAGLQRSMSPEAA